MARLSAWYVLAPALTAVAALVAFLPGHNRGTEWYQEATHRIAVERAVSRLDRRIRELEARATMLGRAAGRPAVTRGTLTVVYVSPVTQGEATAYADSLLAETRRLFGVADPRGRAVVYLATWDSLTALGRSAGRVGWYNSGMIGELAEPCVAIADHNIRPSGDFKTSPLLRNLGGCGFILALGAPGAAITAASSNVNISGDRWSGFGEALDVPKRRWIARDPCVPDARGCVRGITVLSGRLLAWIHRDFGATAMERLWKHDGDLAGAVVAVTGMPLERAGSAYVHSTITVASGPVKGWPAEFGRAGISIAVSLALALALGRRRQVT